MAVAACAAYAGMLATWPAPSQAQGNGFSLRFYGHGAGNIDRVRIPLGNPSRPVNVGNGDFTIEFWMKANLAENGTHQCVSAADDWINGNTIIDRDIFGVVNETGDYGISLANGRIAFGVRNANFGITLCGTSSVANISGDWRHIAVQRRQSDGRLQLYVDGMLEAEVTGPTGQLDYQVGRTTNYPNDPFLVFGAEKHDVGPQYPSYSGLLDEVRLSTVLRYTANFTRPPQPFTPDLSTMGLYHFDEGPVGACSTGFVITDSSGAMGGPSNGECRYGSPPAPQGPEFTTDIPPFGSPTATNTATNTPTDTSVPVDTPTPTQTPTNTPISSPTPTDTPMPTPTPTPTPTSTSLPPPVAFDRLPEAIPLAKQTIVRWETNIPANSQVRYGETCASLTTVLMSTTQTDRHSMVISGLVPQTGYCFQVRSDNGLTATDWSADQSFTTLESAWHVYLPATLRTYNP